MTPDQQFLLAVLTLIASTITTVLTIVTRSRLKEVSDRVEVVHKATNSMKDQLVAATASAEFARGRLPDEVPPPHAGPVQPQT